MWIVTYFFSRFSWQYFLHFLVNGVTLPYQLYVFWSSSNVSFIFCQILTKLEFGHDLVKIPSRKFIQWEPIVQCGHTNKQTGRHNEASCRYSLCLINVPIKRVFTLKDAA